MACKGRKFLGALLPEGLVTGEVDCCSGEVEADQETRSMVNQDQETVLSNVHDCYRLVASTKPMLQQ